MADDPISHGLELPGNNPLGMSLFTEMDDGQIMGLPGKIIIINGTSSSGKSSIVKALQDLLPEPSLDLGIDKFIFALPERYLERPLWDDVLGLADKAGETGFLLVSAMHHAARAAALQGMTVVLDHVLVEPAWAAECARLFEDLPAWLVGVRCPLEVLEARERQRRNRTLGQARLQYERVHAHKLYDLEVDTSLLNPQECAAAIAAMLQNQPPRALAQFYISSRKIKL